MHLPVLLSGGSERPAACNTLTPPRSRGDVPVKKELYWPVPGQVAIAASALLGLGALAPDVQADDGIPAVTAASSLLMAQTNGSERRGERRDDREGDRDNRQDGRDECREEEGAGKDKRDCKQEGRQENRGDGDGDGDDKDEGASEG